MSSSLFHCPEAVPFRGRTLWLTASCIASIVLMFCMTGYSSQAKDEQADAGRVWIDGFPREKSRPVDPFSQSIALALTSAGHPTHWETVMGDSGMAFVMQASEVVPLIGSDGKKVGDAPKDLGKVVGRRNVGWWPLASECEPTYVEFVGRVAGRKLRVLGSGDYPGPKGLADRYKKMHGGLVASIDKGRPVPVRAGPSSAEASTTGRLRRGTIATSALVDRSLPASTARTAAHLLPGRAAHPHLWARTDAIAPTPGQRAATTGRRHRPEHGGLGPGRAGQSTGAPG